MVTMHTSWISALLLLGAISPLAAGETAAPELRPPFKTFRFDEDYRFLRDPLARTEPLDDLKFIPLDDAADYLSLGGESRTRYDYFKNPGFGLRGLSHDDFVLQRLLLSGDLHLGPHFRAFGQIVSGLELGSESPTSPQQDDVLDLQQAFADVIFGDAGNSLTLRGGRMEMGYGSYRLVTARDPTNVRLNFDGLRATFAQPGLTIDAFLTRPVEQKSGVFNDGANDDQTFWGIYSTFPLTPSKSLNADLYYLGLRREHARFDSGVGTDERHSIGSRLWGVSNGFDSDIEGVFQFGTFSDSDIRAWTLASNIGYTWSAECKPRIGLKADIASGDTSRNDGTLGTFYALFPKQSYFSEINLLAPANFYDLHPSFQVKPRPDLTVIASCDFYWRYSVNDAVYGPGRIAIPASASNASYVGTTMDIQAEWAISRQLSLTGYIAHFFKGPVVHDANGRNVEYVGAWLTFKF